MAFQYKEDTIRPELSSPQGVAQVLQTDKVQTEILLSNIGFSTELLEVLTQFQDWELGQSVSWHKIVLTTKIPKVLNLPNLPNLPNLSNLPNLKNLPKMWKRSKRKKCLNGKNAKNVKTVKPQKCENIQNAKVWKRSKR